MEDYELVGRLRKRGPPAIIPHAIHTSGRRWQTVGFVQTTLINQVSMSSNCYWLRCWWHDLLLQIVWGVARSGQWCLTVHEVVHILCVRRARLQRLLHAVEVVLSRLRATLTLWGSVRRLALRTRNMGITCMKQHCLQVVRLHC